LFCESNALSAMKKWAVLFGLVLIAVVVLADTGHLGFLARLYDFPEGDKVGHFVLFGLLSLLVNLAAFERWPKLGRGWLRVRVSLALAVVIGLEELSQRLFPSRQSSIWDLAASYLGVACSAWLATRIAIRKRAPEREA
jgi:VanZ family protein